MNRYPSGYSKRGNVHTLYCPFCGRQNPPGSKVCYACHSMIPKPPGSGGRPWVWIAAAAGAIGLLALAVLVVIPALTTPDPGNVLFPEPVARSNPVQPVEPQSPPESNPNPGPSSGDEQAENNPAPAEPQRPPENSPEPETSSDGPQPGGAPPDNPVLPENPNPSPDSEPHGKIVYNCNIDGFQQVCMMNADGSEQQQLTEYPAAASTYPNLAPDGQSVIFTSNESGDHAIYEMSLADRVPVRLTEPGGDKAYPELSPDGKKIAYSDVADKKDVIYVMNRDGSGLNEIYRGGSHPAWSPDGRRIAFLCADSGGMQVCILKADGSDVQRVTSLPEVGQQVVWSPDGGELAFFAGPKGSRRLCTIRPDGSGYRVLREGHDSVSPSYSPDGEWLVFTEYQNDSKDTPGEIYILRRDGSDARRLTNNKRLDWLPYWGN